MKNNHGFTLLELLVVLVLISCAVGLVSVNFAGRLSSSKIKSTARHLSATIKYAKSYAQLKDKEQMIVLDLDERKYWLKGDKKKSATMPQDVQMIVALPGGAFYDEGKWEIHFFAEGGISSDIEAIMLSNETMSFRIEIDPIIGSSIIQT
jgi:general secretion pathway protein H